MKLLLDTNAMLWIAAGDPSVSGRVRTSLETAEQVIFSVASLWEIAIKVSLKKLAPIPELASRFQANGALRLGIEDRHLEILPGLPFLHRDPFDRLLIAQAKADNLTVVTADKMFSRYGIPVLDLRD
ncbi:type II toxin-antitoxin system VapC family toxin [Paenarthrobacter sp. Z7-10]|uniref:type II toxin-antitoxin system VapC family toxin n=1 Tax=Paenarthrobacter sp. Z7-10 TaxID=2787635 RepID=UPI0022A8D374|nr:type II toxin-antitoxin system VapC family toxin [Paenarthrobacter sp. Z7-10]MCZ2403101.1 type II toxin-antitoxin system VapC family toxin [Paenarthrobacter sp. Z7-10]